MGNKKSGPEYKKEALGRMLANGLQNVKVEIGPNGRTVYTAVEPKERKIVDPVEAERITSEPSMTPEQVKAWFNEPEPHTIGPKKDEAEIMTEDEMNRVGREMLAELREMQLRWAEDARRRGLDRNPGSLMSNVVNEIVEMNRVIDETEAAEAAYGYDDLKCAIIAADTNEEPTVFSTSAGSVEERINDLRQWWMTKASMDVEMVAKKAVTYGSNSLEQLGRKMAQLNGRRVVSAEEAQELGCWVYLTGKAERWTDAVMRGERPKDDTILDIAMYATMAARIRWSGGWPDSQE